MENRFDRVFTSEPSQTGSELPVMFEIGALLQDRLSGKRYAQLKFRNVQSKPVQKAKIELVLYDARSKQIGKGAEFVYELEPVEQDETFGQKTLIPLEAERTSCFSVALQSVQYADGSAENFGSVVLAVPGSVERCRKNRKKLMRRLRLAAFSLVAVAAVFIASVWLVVPAARYWHAKKLMGGNDFREAYDVFVALDDFADSEELRRECIKAEAKSCLDVGDFQGAYDWLVFSTQYYDDAWADLGSFELASDLHQPLYAFVTNIVERHPEFDYWDDSWFGTTNSKALHLLLQSIPSAYEDAGRLQEFFGALIPAGGVHPVAEYVASHHDLINDLWKYSVVRDFATMDETILSYMQGWWYDQTGEQYIRFYENGNDGYYFQASGLSDPSVEHSYYEVVDKTVVYLDADSRKVCDAYRFNFDESDPDVVWVYCFENGQTVLLYRRT